MNSILLKEYVRQAILESDSAKSKSINQNLNDLMVFLGFKKEDMRLIAGKINSLLENYNIIHHQFRNISGTPKQQHSVSIELTNFRGQTYLWTKNSITSLLDMIFHVMCYNLSNDIKQDAINTGLKPDNLPRNVHKDPLGISLFIVPKEVDGKNISHNEIESWHIENCLAEDNHDLFNKLKVYTFKSLEIDDTNTKDIRDYFYQSDRVENKVIEDIKTFVRKERQDRL
jgi:hypothetical protein